MISKAHARFNPAFLGVDIAITRHRGETGHPPDEVLTWTRPDVHRLTEADRHAELPASHWLTLQEDDARALYEALAEHFGHTGHDTRALRRDYDHERGRVDKLINNLIGGTR